jgi:hypothetical protein
VSLVRLRLLAAWGHYQYTVNGADSSIAIVVYEGSFKNAYWTEISVRPLLGFLLARLARSVPFSRCLLPTLG